LDQTVEVNRNGIRFVVWSKWKKQDKRVGTLTVGSGGLRWRPANGKKSHRVSWTKFAKLFEE
jgi:hypothetical protein